MSNAPSPSDQASEMLQKLTLESAKNSPQAAEVGNKTAEAQYAPVDTSVIGFMNPVDRSVSPYMGPNMYYPPSTPFSTGLTDSSMVYDPNGHPSHTYYYGGSELEGYLNPGGSEIAQGAYGDYQHGYGYLPYGTYSPSAITMGQDGHLYGAQQYQYPNYFQPSTSATGAYTPNQPAKVNLGNMENAITNQSNMAKPLSSSYQNPPIKANEFYGYGNRTPVRSGMTNSVLQSNYRSSGKNQNFRSHSNSMGYQNTRAASGQQQPGIGNKMYANNMMYGYRNVYGSDQGFLSSGYYTGNSNRMYLSYDSKYRSRNHINGAYGGYGKDNENERKRGPRFDVESGPEEKILSLKKNSDAENSPIFPGREECNKDDFPETYSDAKFFVIKSYSEDDVHKSIKYGVWTSTTNGNQKLDAAYKEAQEKPGGCPVFLFFSVNASAQFVGLAEMLGPVEFEKTVDHWQQDKWHGCFPVKWHIIKDVPNSTLRHIKLENNENKPVTNSRDTQEIRFDQGIQMIKIFNSQLKDTCILDDFEFYEDREKAMQEKKARHRQFHKQAFTTESTVVDSGTKNVDGEPKLLEGPVAARGEDASASVPQQVKDNKEVD